jgi:hypothetical protein
VSLAQRVERMVFAFNFGDDRRKAVRELAVEVKELEAALANLTTLRPHTEWHEDDGDVLWWLMPIVEPPYCGSMLSDDFPWEPDPAFPNTLMWTPLPVVHP